MQIRHFQSLVGRPKLFMNAFTDLLELAEVLFLSGQTDGLDDLVRRSRAQDTNVVAEWDVQCFLLLARCIRADRSVPLPKILETLSRAGMHTSSSSSQLASVFCDAVLRASRPEWLPVLDAHGLYDEHTVLRWTTRMLDYRTLPFLVRHPRRRLSDKQIVDQLKPRLTARASNSVMNALQLRTHQVLAQEIVESWLRSRH